MKNSNWAKGALGLIMAGALAACGSSADDAQSDGTQIEQSQTLTDADQRFLGFLETSLNTSAENNVSIGVMYQQVRDAYNSADKDVLRQAIFDMGAGKIQETAISQLETAIQSDLFQNPDKMAEVSENISLALSALAQMDSIDASATYKDNLFLSLSNALYDPYMDHLALSDNLSVEQAVQASEILTALVRHIDRTSEAQSATRQDLDRMQSQAARAVMAALNSEVDTSDGTSEAEHETMVAAAIFLQKLEAAHSDRYLGALEAMGLTEIPEVEEEPESAPEEGPAIEDGTDTTAAPEEESAGEDDTPDEEPTTATETPAPTPTPTASATPTPPEADNGDATDDPPSTEQTARRKTSTNIRFG